MSLEIWLNGEVVRIWKTFILACFKVLLQNSAVEENHDPSTTCIKSVRHSRFVWNRFKIRRNLWVLQMETSFHD